MMRVDNLPLISGQFVVSQYTGNGVKGSDVPMTGESGGSVLANDISLPADADKELRAVVTTWPTNGELEFMENGSFVYAGTSDTFQYQLYVDGVAVGQSATVTLTVGTTTPPTDPTPTDPPPAFTQYPSPSDVRAGVVYGLNGEYTGTMTTVTGTVLGVIVSDTVGVTLDGKIVLH